jgi:HEPN domain-containing protein
LPFVGAGFSKNGTLPAGSIMPDWEQLASQLAAEAAVDNTQSPPAIAQEYQRRFGRVQLVEAIRSALHFDEVQPGAAHRAFCDLPFDTVYTTNFDLLLEQAYTESGRPFRSLVGELQMPFHAGRLASSIVKMHGDLRHEEHIVVTAGDYEGFVAHHPIVATHLSAMLITRTPFFIGYSLTDPDFQQIRDVVRARLGTFERMSYLLQFDWSAEQIANALQDNIHVISLRTARGQSRDEALRRFFESVLAELDESSTSSIRDLRPDAFEQLEAPIIKKAVEYASGSQLLEASSRLCFVMMPFGEEFDDVYSELILPAVLDVGMETMRADQIAAPGMIIEQVRSAIQQARLCVADVTGGNPNVLYEVGYAQALDKPLVLLARDMAGVPFDLRHLRVLVYGGNPSASRMQLRALVSYVAFSEKLAKAERLTEHGEYSGAIAAAAVVLEQHLREALSKRPPKDLRRMTLGQLVERITRGGKLGLDLASRLADVVGIRNRAVHEVEERSRQEAEFVLRTVNEVVALLAVGHGEGANADG